MTEKGSEPVNPGQAMYDRLSDEAKAAVDALPDYPFIGKHALDKAEQLVTTLKRINQNAPEIWSTRPDSNGDLDLRIGRLKLVSCYREDRLGLLVKRSDDMSESLKHCIDQNATSWRSSSYPDFRRVVSTRELRDSPLYHEILDAHHRAADELAFLPHPFPETSARHRDDWRVKLAIITGTRVPAPLYVPEDRLGLPMSLELPDSRNPEEALSDTLSPEGDAAVDALPGLLFDHEVGRNAATLLAKEILRVHERGAHEHIQSLWSIQCDGAGNGRGFVVVNVGSVNTISRDKLGVRFVVLREEVAGLEQAFGESVELTDRTYSERAFLAELSLHNSDVASDLPHALEVAHIAALDRILAEGWQINQRWKWHRDDWRVKLADLTRLKLPAPSYVPRNRIGLPMDAMLQSALNGNETSDTSQSSERSGMELTSLNQRLERFFGASGLTYSPSQIASFYTALQTKGFVILSGISGTGKSKIAQRFAKMLPVSNSKSIRGPIVATSLLRAFERDSRAHEVDTMNIRREHFANVEIPDIDNQMPVELHVGDASAMGSLVTHTKENGSRITDVKFPPSLVTPFRELRLGTPHFHVGLYGRVGQRLDAIALARVQSALPLEISKKGSAESIREEDWNSLFLPVRPDWRDGKALIGYHNPLTGEYVRTGFLDFVIAAADDYRAGNRNAFFVILDEMNLAHVEYYFADVLSVIESGRDDEGWTVEGIPLAVGEEDADLPEVLKLPPNLYIVGTVNMDETTHPFSPKVLDRAFTIELTDVDFSDYPPDGLAGDDDPSDKERRALLDAFIGEGYPRIDKGQIRDVVDRHPRFRADLDTLNRGLQRYRMHFGYRVFDEIMQFVHHAQVNGLFESTDDAFDHAVLMKVLPKFNGSRAKLENALFELLQWSWSGGMLIDVNRAALEARLAQLTDERRPFSEIVKTGSGGAEDDWRYPATGRRAALMMQDLYTDGFASFG